MRFASDSGALSGQNGDSTLESDDAEVRDVFRFHRTVEGFDEQFEAGNPNEWHTILPEKRTTELGVWRGRGYH